MIAGLALAGLQTAPATAGGETEAPPPASSPALSAIAPELAALPGVILVGYPVNGRSPRGIRESINESRPRPEQGDAFDARTDWRYQTRWRSGPTGGCDPTTAEVDMTVVVTLPELTTREALDPREREQWDRYFAALIGHEHNHVRVALAGAEQLRTYMRSAPDCPAMEAAQRQIGASIQAANDAYDQRTRHGRTEGATYP
jgi:predicted secreted Zn-dependent protease